MDGQLKSKGWYLTNEGMDLCKEGLVNPSVDTLIQRALDIDLRLLSSGNHDEANKGKTDTVQGPLILQIQKIRNVAAPKLNEESSYAPKLLRIQLTDGNSTYSGLLLHSIPKIDMNTTPGTKLLITGKITLKQGLMLLDQKNTKVLGGHVDEMVERWKLAKTLSQFTRATKVEGAPPPWVPFGQRKNMAASHRNDHSGKGKKSLDGNQKDLTETDKAFEEQRNAAIQEVGKHQSKKFGGGKAVPSNIDRLKESRKAHEEKVEAHKAGPATKSNATQGIYRSLSTDSNKPDEGDIQKLTSMGFGREPSIAALKNSNGNVDSAIDSLLGGGTGGPGGNDRGSRYGDNQGGFRGNQGSFRGSQGNYRGSGRNFDSRGSGRGYDNRRGGGRGPDSRAGGRNFDSRGRGRGSDNRRKRGDEEQEDEFPAQPSGGTTLFDFLESKLTKDSNKETASGPSSGNQRSRNYAREQPNSVRESGIKFVHGGGRDKEDSRRGGEGRYDRGSKDDAPPRSGQSDNHKGPHNDRKTNPRRTDSRPQNDRGGGRPRQDKGAAPNNQRTNQYTLPPRFQRRQEVESKKGTSGRQEADRDERDQGREDEGSKRPPRDSASIPQTNGKHNHGPRGGNFQPQHQRHQQNSGYERGPLDESTNMVQWNIGDLCMAKYWEDKGFYNATITAIHPSGKTCVVLFMEYGNQEEVLMSDIHPLPNQSWGGMPPPQQFAPPNHMMVPQPYHESRNAYSQGSHQRYGHDQGSNNYYHGGRR